MSILPTALPSIDATPGPQVAQPLPPDRPVRWGLMATGKIAKAFATDLGVLPDAEIAAVGARRLESAQEFAATYGPASGPAAAYGSYQELVDDPTVDVVYVATPHALHKEHVLMAIAAGKAVLSEKPITLTAAEAEELVTAAREAGVFLMEGMWMRCNPMIRRLQKLLETGVYGEVRQIRADLGFVVDKPPTDRLLDPALGGGALLDMGIYPLTFAHLFLGQPSFAAAAAYLSPAGADLNLALSLGYDSGAVASLTSSMIAWSPRTASIATDKGRFDLPPAFHHPRKATWTAHDIDPDLGGGESVVELEEEIIGGGLAHEAIEVIRCLRSGEIESPLAPLDDTVAMMRLMDLVRGQIGVRYAADDA